MKAQNVKIMISKQVTARMVSVLKFSIYWSIRSSSKRGGDGKYIVNIRVHFCFQFMLVLMVLRLRAVYINNLFKQHLMGALGAYTPDHDEILPCN